MAARLTVIVSQAAARDGVVADLEEELVGELLMADGIDANLVGPLEHMSADSTDCLCISGFRGSLALLSWLDTKEISIAWERLGLGGQVRKFGVAATQTGVRSVVHFQMQPGVTVENLTQQLRKLQSDMAVKTVGIAGISIAPPSANKSTSASVAGQDLAPREQKQDIAIKRTSSGAASRAVDARAADDEEEDFPDLDQLVDDFDALDI